MESRDSVIAALEELPATVQGVDFKERGYHLEVILDSDRLRSFAKLMLEKEFYLSFISGLHVRPAIEVTYQFANHAFPCRTVARVAIDTDNSLPTISDIFPGADWHERETKDFFGVIFRGHPNLEPLLLAEDMADLKPLLKSEKSLKDRSAVTRPMENDEEKSSTKAAGVEGA
jgi:NADH-quinone oxidoreductase subunit C